MILRSIMKNVRDQNWFAVGLDFLIVVVGVFIGIQVANWNEVRQEPMLERGFSNGFTGVSNSSYCWAQNDML